jgi:hypothetical protein
MFPLVIGEIAKSVLGIGGDMLAKRQKLAEIKIEGQTQIEVARAQAECARLQKLEDAEVSWDAEAERQMEMSWKDEYLTILLSLPAILAFFGTFGRTAVINGFAALNTAPEWYRVSFLTIISASFGVRTLVNKFGFGKK